MTQGNSLPSEFYLLFPAIFGSGVLAWFLTREFLAFAPKLGLIDVPNERSSHTKPTLRGGGVGFVLSLAIFILAMTLSQNLESLFGYGLFLTSSLVAATGWVDDRKGLRASYRLCIHLLASAILMGLVFETLSLPFTLYFAASVLFIAWMVNLYNFMDGTDGLAGLQGVTVAFFSALHCYFSGDFSLFAFFLTVALSVAGFLFFNWSPAKVFMGDVGSGFLGFLFGALMIFADAKQTLPLSLSLLLMSVFLVDTAYTLVVRFFHRENIASAHRTHAYQKAIQRGWSHQKLAIVVSLFNLFLGVLTFAVRFEHLTLNIACGLALVPLFVWQIYQRAGCR
ncbi:MAG: glycosyltransferase family 4 protein [Bdellovibrionales bacterium]